MIRVRQVTDSHCGPAVLEMLASFVGEDTKQNKIVKAAKIERSILKNGMSVEEMAMAEKALLKKSKFWFKKNSSVADLIKIITTYKYPVGVEWQGIFPKEYKDDDEGHYSVVTFVDKEKDAIWVANPFRSLAGKDRKLKLSKFEKRWWDMNDKTIEKRAIFVIAKDSEIFPRKLKMATID